MSVGLFDQSELTGDSVDCQDNAYQLVNCNTVIIYQTFKIGGALDDCAWYNLYVKVLCTGPRMQDASQANATIWKLNRHPGESPTIRNKHLHTVAGRSRTESRTS